MILSQALSVLVASSLIVSGTAREEDDFKSLRGLRDLGPKSSDCPYKNSLPFKYDVEINVNVRGGSTCTSIEREELGMFLDERFDREVSDTDSVGPVEMRSVVCADDPSPIRRGRNLLQDDWDPSQFNWTYRGGGECGDFCGPDDDDARRKRRLQAFEDVREELEQKLSDTLTLDVNDAFGSNERSCLSGSDVTIVVGLTETTNGNPIADTCHTDAVFCCAPKGDVQYDCSNDKYNPATEKWWCHQNPWRCQSECEGVWVNAKNPPTCASFWAPCETDGDCCFGATCAAASVGKKCQPRKIF